ncbi:MAG: hypothetical protein J0I12_11495 [Candidatus Eremiobacteraeota bacterium]|nr:hypothetical protein [Candidatus Eremiobacteraeota bacterium]
MNQEPQGQGRALAVVLLLVAAVAWIWLRPWSSLEPPDDPQPEITTQATSLSEAEHATLLAELKVREENLDLFEQQLKAAEAKDGSNLTVPAATVKEIVRKLDSIGGRLDSPQLDFVQLRHTREEIRDLWQDRAVSLKRFLAVGARGDLPVQPPLEHSLVSRLSGDPQAEAYVQHYQRLAEQLRRLTLASTEAFDADLAGRVERLKEVVWLRYRVLRRMSDVNWMALFESPGPWLDDCLFELRNYPDRKYGLYLLARSRLERRVGYGRAFWLELGQEVGLALLGLILLSSALVAADRREQVQTTGLRGVWTWVLVWPVCQLGLVMVSEGVAECLRPIFLLGQVFAFYRAYLQLADGPLLQAIVHSQVGQKVGVRTRALRDLRLLGRAFWLQASLNTVLMALAGPGILVATCEVLTGFLVQFLYWMLSWSWRVELGEALAAMLPGSPRLGSWFGSLCSSPLLGLVLAPLAVPVVMALGLLHWLVRRTVRYDWAKRMSTGVLMRWMESSRQQEAGLLPLSADYRQAFLASTAVPIEAWDLSAPGFRPQLEGAVRSWSEGRGSESLMVVHGPNGSGRDRVVEHLEDQFSADLRVLKLEIPERVTTAQALLRHLQALVQVEAPSWEALAESLQEQPRTLVIVPQSQRLFLAALGGFEAMDQLLRFMTGTRKNFFWCLVMTSQSQRYLRLALSDRWYVALTLAVPRWSEGALGQMLLARHGGAGGTLRYSQAVLRAAEATPGVSAESFYFHILREVSGGNPTVASELWLEATRVNAEGEVVVGLPSRKPAYLLTTLAPAAGYLLAAVMRHGELTRDQAARVTALPISQLVLAWERCQEIGILADLGGPGLSISRGWLVDVAHFLRERNLLDGD